MNCLSNQEASSPESYILEHKMIFFSSSQLSKESFLKIFSGNSNKWVYNPLLHDYTAFRIYSLADMSLNFVMGVPWYIVIKLWLSQFR